MSTPEPGLDRHEWETEFEALAEQLEEGPAQALPELADLVERMLIERGLAPGDPVADDGNDPEILAGYRSAREVANLVEAGEAPDPGDVGNAVQNLRGVFDHLVSERGPP